MQDKHSFFHFIFFGTLIALFVIIWGYQLGQIKTPPKTDEQLLARIQAVGTVAVNTVTVGTGAANTGTVDTGSGNQQTAASGTRDGASIYQTSCQTCHAAGVAGAPKLGDKTAWQTRLANGVDTLLTSVIKGKGAMPPKGMCMDCSDDELKIAVDYILNQSK